MDELHDDEFYADEELYASSSEVIAKIGPLNIEVVDSDIDDLGHFVAIDVCVSGAEEECTLYPTADITAELVEALLKANRLAAEKNSKMEGLREDAITKCDRVFGLSPLERRLLIKAIEARLEQDDLHNDTDFDIGRSDYENLIERLSKQ